jgi:hypothetical protein
MAKCPGKCSEVDKKSLKFFKIDQAGPIAATGDYTGGKWSTDEMIANDNTMSVNVPENLAPGDYVLRHEIISLPSADKPNGAQNYPMCVNLEVGGSGTNNPAGVPATSLYKSSDSSIQFSIYRKDMGPDVYDMPGPALCPGAISKGQSGAKPSGQASGEQSGEQSGEKPSGAAPSYGGNGPAKYSNSTMSADKGEKKLPPKPPAPKTSSKPKPSPASQVSPASSTPSPAPAPAPAPAIPAAATVSTGSEQPPQEEAAPVTLPSPAPAGTSDYSAKYAVPATDSTAGATATDADPDVQELLSKVSSVVKEWTSKYNSGRKHARDIFRRSIV